MNSMSQIMMVPKALQNAVLFLVFNRPETTRHVFGAIRKAKPPRLYVAADGPRTNHPSESNLVAMVREIATAVDWQCEVKTLFREENLGCKHAISSAINWFFEHEEQGIILEDDCLPHHSFFGFCEEMLQKYADTKSIWSISGFNPKHPGEASSRCFLSQNPSVWGWASWRDRWNRYDVNMSLYKPGRQLKLQNHLPRYVNRYYRKSFERTRLGKIDTWDYQFSFLILSNNGFVVKPYCNLISNIGVQGTHSTIQDINHYIELGAYVGNASNVVEIDHEEDLWFYETRIKSLALRKVLRAARTMKNWFS